MGETDRGHRNEYKQPKRSRFLLGATDNALVALFAINVVFFLILMTIKVGMLVGEKTPEYFYTHVMSCIELPSSLTKFSE
jgi:hypothetical protein